MRNLLENYYFNFKNIYNKQNYPKWFKFCDEHNKQEGFGKEGYIEGKKGHELGHYAIFQTPIPELQKTPEKTRIIIVGKNNSWFVPNKYRMKESLDIVKKLENGIPKRNFYTERESDFAKFICNAFEELKSFNLLERNTVGLNRVWLQTGPNSSNINKMKESRVGASDFEIFEGSSLVNKFHKWTEEIIKILNPELVLLLGTNPNGADNLFEKREGVYKHTKGEFFIKHCRHPAVGGQTECKKNIKEGLERIVKI